VNNERKKQLKRDDAALTVAKNAEWAAMLTKAETDRADHYRLRREEIAALQVSKKYKIYLYF